jgi:hypothetical protein
MSVIQGSAMCATASAKIMKWKGTAMVESSEVGTKRIGAEWREEIVATMNSKGLPKCVGYLETGRGEVQREGASDVRRLEVGRRRLGERRGLTTAARSSSTQGDR